MALSQTEPGKLEYVTPIDSPPFRAFVLMVNLVGAKLFTFSVNGRTACDEVYFKNWKKSPIMHTKSPGVDEYLVQLTINPGDKLNILAEPGDGELRVILLGYIVEIGDCY